MPRDQLLTVVLVEPQTPGNVGAVARAMANFGIPQLCLVTSTPEIATEKEAVRRARHGGAVLSNARCVPTLDAALEDVDWAMGFSARPGRDRGDAFMLREGISRARLAGRVAAVFGREDDGLHTSEIQRCNALVTIPTADATSLNLSHAVAVFAHCWHEGSLPVRATQVASQVSRGKFLVDVEELMRVGGFLTGERPRRPVVAMQRLLDRALPNARELRILHGVVRRLLQRLPPK